MKKMIYLASFGLLLATLSVSCNKKDDTKPQEPLATTKQLILGKWQLVYSARDINNDGILEENEKEFPANGTTEQIEYKNDGGWLRTIQSPSSSSKASSPYEISNDGKTVTAHGETGVIEILNETELRLKFSANNFQWRDYKKVQ